MAAIRTLGEAYSASWAIRMKCQRGDQRGIVKIDACRFETDLCLKTLVATRGREFPIGRIADRIRCPIHPDATPVLLLDQDAREAWMNAPWEIARELQRPPPAGALRVVTTGEKKDDYFA